MRKRTLVVDFDGTIVEHAFPEIGKLKPGVIGALRSLQEHYRIIVSSCRNNSRLNKGDIRYQEAMKKFLVEAGVPHDGVDEGDQGKIVAHVYVDDRAVRFQDNWPHIARLLVQRDFLE